METVNRISNDSLGNIPLCFVYIICSEKGFYYCGISNDITKRLLQHNKGLNVSTRHQKGYVIKFLKLLKSRKEAHRMEQQIKNRGVERWYRKYYYDNRGKLI